MQNKTSSHKTHSIRNALFTLTPLAHTITPAVAAESVLHDRTEHVLHSKLPQLVIRKHIACISLV